jgi:PhnB protein
MKAIIPYLVFPGTCKEAMQFYASIFDGEITKMQAFDKAPMPVPKEFEHRIFDSELRAGSLILKASDDLPGYEVQLGSHVSLFTALPNSEAQARIFSDLAEGGQILFPLENNFGMLKDKYGIQWMLSLEQATE